MKTININFKNFWNTFSPSFFIKYQFKSLNFNFNISDNPDYIIYSTFGNDKLNPNTTNIFWSMESIWDINKFDVSDYDWAFYFFPEHMVDHERYKRINMTIPLLTNNKFNPEKIDYDYNSKFCNFIYRHSVDYRNNFFTKLSKYKHIDSPGLCMNNMKSIGGYSDPLQSRKDQNWTEMKLEFIKPYKFTIAFENHFNMPGYTTEKIIHPLLTTGIPIYCGNPYIHEDYNPNRFLNYHDYDNEDNLIDAIIELDNDDEKYYKMLNEVCAFSHREDEINTQWTKIFS